MCQPEQNTVPIINIKLFADHAKIVNIPQLRKERILLLKTIMVDVHSKDIIKHIVDVIDVVAQKYIELDSIF